MFKAFSVANHIFIGIIEGIKEVFDEVKGGLIPLAKSFRIVMEGIHEEVKTGVKPARKKSPASKKKKKPADKKPKKQAA